MCGFIAQLVEQRTGNGEVTGSNPVEALIFFFSGFFFPIALIGKFTAMIILHSHSYAMLEQSCYYSKECCKNVATLWFAKNSRCESSRVTSPLG